jgi:hypothetical protein
MTADDGVAPEQAAGAAVLAEDEREALVVALYDSKIGEYGYLGRGVPFLFKQWGEWTPDEHPDSPYTYVTAGPDPGIPFPPLSAMLWRPGKKAAGRTLDGRTWDEYPGAPA